MHRYLFIPILGILLLTACAVAVGSHGAQVAIAPPLPAIVELVSPYYVHDGYEYYYHGQLWYYAPSRGERWIALPRDRYPKEIRFRGEGREQYQGGRRDHGDERYGRGDRNRWGD